MTVSTATKPFKAVLVGLQLPGITESETESSLAELKRLVTTMGAEVVGQMWQKRSSSKNATVLGDGKLKELASWTGGTGQIGPGFVRKKHKAALKFKPEDDELDEDEDLIDDLTDDEGHTQQTPNERADLVIFDCDLSPSQLRNIESATGVSALDRTGVIIEIFSRHARSRAAKLQVEIARLKYMAPRIRETGALEDRQEGGGGKGSGETSVELDRRKIRDRIKELREELESIAHEQDHRRTRREKELSVALVGYTNAGKSSLMRALTGSEVLVADKLFATLDTTVRSLYPESHPKILISDTVGFIKKLPHDLVASFKSTLDEAAAASLLLYVVDASDPTFRSQLEVTRTVLSEVGAQDLESLLILNKSDRLLEDTQAQLRREFPEAIFISTRRPEDIASLRLRLISHFEKDMLEEDVFVPYTAHGVIGEIRGKMRVLTETYDDQGTTFRVKAPQIELQKIRGRLARN